MFIVTENGRAEFKSRHILLRSLSNKFIWENRIYYFSPSCVINTMTYSLWMVNSRVEGKLRTLTLGEVTGETTPSPFPRIYSDSKLINKRNQRRTMINYVLKSTTLRI